MARIGSNSQDLNMTILLGNLIFYAGVAVGVFVVAMCCAAKKADLHYDN